MRNIEEFFSEFDKANELFFLDSFDKALEAFRHLEKWDDLPQALKTRVKVSIFKCLLKLDKPSQVVEKVEELLQALHHTNFDTVELYILKGQGLFDLKMYEEAFKVFKNAIEICQDDIQLDYLNFLSDWAISRIETKGENDNFEIKKAKLLSDLEDRFKDVDRKIFQDLRQNMDVKDVFEV